MLPVDMQSLPDSAIAHVRFGRSRALALIGVGLFAVTAQLLLPREARAGDGSPPSVWRLWRVSLLHERRLL